MEKDSPKKGVPQNEEFSVAQKEAIRHTTGPVLVLAGAGAGKTKTITARIAELIASGVAPRSILAITFTNKAAEEMRERVLQVIEKDPRLNLPVSLLEYPFVSTFHSLCVHILRDHASKLNLPRQFSIYDRTDSRNTIKEVLKEMGIDPKQMDPGKILSIISQEKGNLKGPMETANQSDAFRIVLSQIYERYETYLRREKALDFDDLLLKTVRLLQTYAEIKEMYQNRWQYIHVDEYQDTNRVQYALVEILAGKHRNIFVVGDIDQTIYTWRGAHIKNLLHFEKDFPESKVILLEENYRSTKTIIAAANNVIKKNKIRYEKNLYTRNEVGDPLSLYAALDENDEAAFVAQKAALLIESGFAPKQIGVLYRANFQSRVLEQAFLDASVPYQVLGTRFFERKEVKDVISFLKAAINPESLSDVKRIINIPARQ